MDGAELRLLTGDLPGRALFFGSVSFGLIKRNELGLGRKPLMLARRPPFSQSNGRSFRLWAGDFL
jgi:hypothetical protein